MNIIIGFELIESYQIRLDDVYHVHSTQRKKYMEFSIELNISSQYDKREEACTQRIIDFSVSNVSEPK